MSLRTYQIQANGHTINIKAKKDIAENFKNKIHQITNIIQYRREITGVVGGKENSNTVWSPFGPAGGTMANPEAFKAAKTAFFESLPDPITLENIREVTRNLLEVFNEHVPVVDSRRTPEEVEEANRATEQVRANQKAKANAFRDRFCKPDKIEVPVGFMAIILKVTFNDSDAMSDYYAPHRSVGDSMVLGLVREGARREETARDILARYPDLTALEWGWHTQNYSMGHGNYLLSEFPEGLTWYESAYDGRKEVRCRYEITFDKYNKEIYPYKDYPGDTSVAAHGSEPIAPSNGNGITILENEAKNGVEIKFDEKPERSVIDFIKSKGFRFSRRQCLWYARRTAGTMAFVKDFQESYSGG